VFSIVVLKDKLDAALELLGDVLLKPRFAEADFARAKGNWLDELKNQERDPKQIAERLTAEHLFGPLHKYGHARMGDAAGSISIGLADVKTAYARLFTEGGVHFVVAGDVTKASAEPLLARLADSIAKRLVPTAPLVSASTPAFVPPFGKVIVFDKPDAPQSVVSFVARGFRADDRSRAAAPRMNAVLGGSFTSRLNQDIREERGLAYGASSRLSFSREPGAFVASASLFAKKAAEGTKALVEDVYAYADKGPTEEESAKSQLLSRSDLVETFESVSTAAARMARNVGVGLPAGIDSEFSVLRDNATQADLARIAKELLPRGQAFIVYVGPKSEAEKVLPDLKSFGITELQIINGAKGKP
jgi:zinc protease